MSDFDTKIRSIIFELGVDGGSKIPNNLENPEMDGFVSSKEAGNALQILMDQFETAKSKSLPTDDLLEKIHYLAAARTKALEEEACGIHKGYPYMSEAFYRMDLSPDERRYALFADSLGDQNGLPTGFELAPGTRARDVIGSHIGAQALERLIQKLPHASPIRLGKPDESTLPPTLFPYRGTYEQMKDGLVTLAQAFPDLMQLEDIGDSHAKINGENDHDIWAIHLSNTNSDMEDKPTALWIMGVHGDEIVNPYLAMRWIEKTLRGFGIDPELTALLNTRKIVIVPMVNPDGYPRKRYNAAGIDLNRDWRTVDYTSGTPLEAPEPEIASIMPLIHREQPMIIIDWHSNGYVVGHGAKHPTIPSPLAEEALEQASKRFAAFEGYDLVTWRRYGGSTDEFGRDNGFPAWTVETCHSKQPTEGGVATAWSLTEPMMTYSAKIADTPLERVKGPTGLENAVTDQEIMVTMSDEASGGDTIQAVEWITDPMTPPGEGNKFEPKDGNFDSVVEEAIAKLPESIDSNLVFVRGQDIHGNWGPLSAVWVCDPAVIDPDRNTPALC